MKFKYNLLACALFSMAACTPVQDIYDEIDAEGFEIVRTCEEYVLTESDYKEISKRAEADAKTDDEKMLAKAVASELALNTFASADKYVAGVLAKNFYSWTDGSNAYVTYRTRRVEQTELEQTYADVKYYKVSDKEYEEIVGNPFGCFLPNKSYKIKDLLKKNYPDAKEDAMVLVDYREAVETPTMIDTEKFETLTKYEKVYLYRWQQKQLVEKAACSWEGREHGGNKYAQISANETKGTCDTWLITPALQVEENQTFSFDLKYGYYKGDCLQVMISDKYQGDKIVESDWMDVLPKMPGFDKVEKNEKGYGRKFATLTYTFDKSYSGKTVYIAFRYKGDGENVTTTVQVDNVKFPSAKPMLGVEKEDKQYQVLYVYEKDRGKLKWDDVFEDNLVVLSPEDYVAMGGKIAEYGNFSDKKQPTTYLPTLLSQRYPYAQEGDAVMTVYCVKGKNEKEAASSQFNFKEGKWVTNDSFVMVEKETYLKKDGEWKFDPTISFKVSKDQYQFLVNWTAKNKKDYLDKKYKDNSEYWFGASSHHRNFNIDINTRKSYDSEKILEGKDEVAIKKYLIEQMAEGCRMILVEYYPNAESQVNGLDLYFKVDAATYGNGARDIYTFTFKSLGNGQFEWDKQVVSRPQ